MNNEIPINSQTYDRKKELLFFILMSLLTVVLWQFEMGLWIMYPFTILATWFHEMAHGLAALILGGDFLKLLIYPNGSGVAYFTTDLILGNIGLAIVAAAGPIGPSIFGSILILLSSKKYNNLIMLMFSLFILLSVVLWVRSWFGAIFMVIFGLSIFFFAIYASPKWNSRLSTFIGIQAIISVYESLPYLFSTSSEIGMTSGKTDTEVIQSVLFLPYWFWAIIILLFNFLLFYYSIKKVYFVKSKKIEIEGISN